MSLALSGIVVNGCGISSAAAAKSVSVRVFPKDFKIGIETGENYLCEVDVCKRASDGDSKRPIVVSTIGL